MEIKETKRVPYIDRLRVLSMVAVVILHVAAQVSTNAADSPDSPLFLIANILNAATRFAVPVFLMISGALLLSDPRPATLDKRFRGRIIRIALPLLSWTAIYLAARLAAGLSPAGLLTALKQLLHKPAEIHLWYLYALLAIILLLPFIKLITDHAPRKLLWYGVSLWFTFSCLWQSAAGLIPDLQIAPYADLHILGSYPGFFFLGYLLHTTDIRIKRGWLAAIAALCVFVTFAGGWLMTRRDPANGLNVSVFQYFMPNIAVFSACVFAYAKTGKQTALPKWLSALASLSFGVYLAHELFIRAAFHFFGKTLNPWLLLTITPAAALLFSLAFTAVIRMIPVVNTILLGEKKS